jgi:hypothetical protein
MFAIKRSLKLNNREATLMAKHAGWRRVVFNMGLSLHILPRLLWIQAFTCTYSNPKSSVDFLLPLVRGGLGWGKFYDSCKDCYKCKMYGAIRVLVGQWFPSSLTCSICGNQQDMPRLYQDLWLSILRYVDWPWLERQYQHFGTGNPWQLGG